MTRVHVPASSITSVRKSLPDGGGPSVHFIPGGINRTPAQLPRPDAPHPLDSAFAMPGAATADERAELPVSSGFDVVRGLKRDDVEALAPFIDEQVRSNDPARARAAIMQAVRDRGVDGPVLRLVQAALLKLLKQTNPVNVVVAARQRQIEDRTVPDKMSKAAPVVPAKRGLTSKQADVVVTAAKKKDTPASKAAAKYHKHLDTEDAAAPHETQARWHETAAQLAKEAAEAEGAGDAKRLKAKHVGHVDAAKKSNENARAEKASLAAEEKSKHAEAFSKHADAGDITHADAANQHTSAAKAHWHAASRYGADDPKTVAHRAAEKKHRTAAAVHNVKATIDDDAPPPPPSRKGASKPTVPVKAKAKDPMQKAEEKKPEPDEDADLEPPDPDVLAEEADKAADAEPKTGGFGKSAAFTSAFDVFVDTMSKAEGDRGGRVIGHTSSGKPVYAPNAGYHAKAAAARANPGEASKDVKDEAEHAHVAAHADFTTKDHADAAKLHDNEEGRHYGKDPHASDAHRQMKLAHTNAMARAMRKAEEHMDPFETLLKSIAPPPMKSPEMEKDKAKAATEQREASGTKTPQQVQAEAAKRDAEPLEKAEDVLAAAAAITGGGDDTKVPASPKIPADPDKTEAAADGDEGTRQQDDMKKSLRGPPPTLYARPPAIVLQPGRHGGLQRPREESVLRRL